MFVGLNQGMGKVWISGSIGLFLIVGCTSSKKRAEETALAIERMKREHQQYMQEQSSVQKDKRQILDRELVDGIAARVNNEIILISDVDRFSKLLVKRMGSPLAINPFKTRAARRQVLERLIEMKLIEQRAKELGIVVKEEDVEDAVEKIKEKTGMTHEDFLAHLAKEGLPYKDYLKKVKTDIQKRRVLEIEVNSRVQVSDGVCKKYYDQHLKEYAKESRARIQQILLLANRARLNKKEMEAIEKKIEAIREKILKGADFGEMAKKYSEGPNGKDGGDIGYFKKGELLPEIEKASFSIPVGQASRIIQTDLGFHLVRVTEREEGQTIPFEKVKDEIHQELWKEAYMKRMQEWIEDLKERAYIDVRI